MKTVRQEHVPKWEVSAGFSVDASKSGTVNQAVGEHRKHSGLTIPSLPGTVHIHLEQNLSDFSHVLVSTRLSSTSSVTAVG